jgi:phosphomannomutase / phosphoglucomutase
MISGTKLFGTNGVRGVFGRDLTLDLVIDLSYSLATFYRTGPIVVGRDGRNSSQIVSQVVISSLNSAGLDVANAGLIPTPCLQFAAKRLGYNGGVMITASHNPGEFNGIKPSAADGVEISREDESTVESIYFSKQFSKIDGTCSEFHDDRIISSYIDNVIELVDIEKIQRRRFVIAIDPGNGVQTTVAPILAKRLGCRVVTANSTIDGTFPARGSEPLLNNLNTLSCIVKGTKADIGVAYDGDGDRSIFCDEKGVIHPGDKTAASIVGYLLRTKHMGANVVCPINTTIAVSKVVNDAGSKVIHTKVGSVEVSREMIKTKSIVGLEENGGFMYGKLNEVRDGVMTTALVLDMLASENQTLSALLASLPKVFQYNAKFKCDKSTASEVVRVCMEHGSFRELQTLDGAKIWIDSETWVMVRPSGTEPLVRMYAESTDQMLLDSKVREYRRLIESTIKKCQPFENRQHF